MSWPWLERCDEIATFLPPDRGVADDRAVDRRAVDDPPCAADGAGVDAAHRAALALVAVLACREPPHSVSTNVVVGVRARGGQAPRVVLAAADEDVAGAARAWRRRAPRCPGPLRSISSVRPG